MSRPAKSEREERSRRLSQWMARAQAGDGESYRTLLDAIGPSVLSFLSRRIADRAEIEDAYQETLIAVHRARHTYQPRRPIEPWLFAIARNVAADYRRRGRRRTYREILSDSIPEQPVESAPGVEMQLNEALRQLPPRQREALEMLKLEGLSVVQAASRAGTTTTALRIRAHRAYAALKAAFRA